MSKYTAACTAARTKILEQCHLKGTICPDNVTNQSITFYRTIKETCSDTANALICPGKYYCPTSGEKYACPIGYYCAAGSAVPRMCPLLHASCPREGMENPEVLATFFMFLAICLLLLIIQKYVVLRITRYNQHVIRAVFKCERTQHSFILSMHKKRLALKNPREPVPSPGVAPTKRQQYPHTHRSSHCHQSASYHRARRNWKQLIHSEAFRRYVTARRINDVMSSKGHMPGTFQFRFVTTPLTVAFDQMKATLPHSGMPLLRNVFGCFRPFNVTALMGSSGAGKTVLLNLLRGKKPFRDTSGVITVNGRRTTSLAPYASVTGFVHQENIMYDELTVLENLKYSALLFNKRGYSSTIAVLPMVYHVLKLLGLSHIMHSTVGTFSRGGISGGQKKSVSIGMELMKEPSLFFLDEPTSGLDAATSISLMVILQRISQNGVTVVATLHQPRSEIFDMVHMLCLLAPGGRLAYFGPAYALSSYLEQLGYICSPACSISDFVMDVIAGFVKASCHENMTSQQSVQRICDLTHCTIYQEFKREWMLGVYPYTTKAFAHHIAADQRREHWWAGCKRKFFVSFQRHVTIYFRTCAAPASSFSSFLTLAVLGVLIAHLFGSIRLDETQALHSHVVSAQISFVMTMLPTVLRVFLFDSMIRDREESGGIMLVPLYLGKLCGSLIDIVLSPVAFVCGYYPFIRAQASFSEYVVLYIALNLAISGLANTCAILFRSRAVAVASGIVIVLWAVGGIQPNVSTIYSNLGYFGHIAVALSPFRRSFEISEIMELRLYSEAYHKEVQLVYDRYQFKASNYYINFGYLLLYWMVTNFIAVLVMLWRRDDCRYWRYFLDSIWYPCSNKITTTSTFRCAEMCCVWILHQLAWIEKITFGIDEVDSDVLNSKQRSQSRASFINACGRYPQSILDHLDHNRSLNVYSEKRLRTLTTPPRALTTSSVGQSIEEVTDENQIASDLENGCASGEASLGNGCHGDNHQNSPMTEKRLSHNLSCSEPESFDVHSGKYSCISLQTRDGNNGICEHLHDGEMDESKGIDQIFESRNQYY